MREKATCPLQCLTSKARILPLICASVLSLPGCHPSAPEVVFVIAGQSNAVGLKVGRSPRVTRVANQMPKRIQLWFEAGDVRKPQRSKGWVPLSEALARPSYHVGPEAGIASVLGQRISRSIGFIKVAFDAAALGAGPNADWHPESKGELYARLIRSVTRAPKPISTTSESWVAGIFWLQGETDAKSGGPGTLALQPLAANRYEDNLSLLVTRLRRDLRQPELPVVIASLGAPDMDAIGRVFGYRGIVLQAQESVASRDPFVRTVPTMDIDRAEDGLHFSFEGQLTLGKRLGESMWQLLDRQNNPPLAR